MLRFGVFELDVTSAELRREGLPVKLQPQPVKVLTLLAEKAGSVVTREDLQAAVWGDSTFVDFDRGLNFCVLQIRNALGDDADNPRFVQTVPRRGYRFVAQVQRIENGAATAVAAESPAAEPKAPKSTTDSDARRLAPRALAAVGLVLALLGGAVLLSRREPPAATPSPARVMLAVLPFENMSGEKSHAFFADGITEELITHLGRVDPETLGVIARTSVLKYKDGAKDIAQIGRELGVSHVLEGSVRREADRVRVTAQLIRVSDQTHLWAESYDRPLQESLSLQDEVAQRVATALRAKLLAANAPVSQPSTRDPRAYEAYLEGRALASLRSADGLTRALERFDAARALDPGYAAAHAAAADALFQIRFRGRDAREVLPKARAAAESALAIDPSSAEALTVLGSVKLWHAWQPTAAQDFLERELRANPSYAPAHHDLAWVRIAQGRLDDAVAAIRRGQELDPLSARATMDVGWVLLRARRYADAAAQARKTLELEPRMLEATGCLAEALAGLGQRSEAVALTRRVMQETGAPASALAALEGVDAAEALRRAGEWRVARSRERALAGTGSWQSVAIDEALLGRRDEALSSLQKALVAHEQSMVVAEFVPAFDLIRSDPRFQTIVDAVKAKDRRKD